MNTWNNASIRFVNSSFTISILNRWKVVLQIFCKFIKVYQQQRTCKKITERLKHDQNLKRTFENQALKSAYQSGVVIKTLGHSVKRW
jgi:hypothetical protein